MQGPGKWDIRGEDYEFKPETSIAYFTDATATDGEIIVKAPELEHNRKTDVVVVTGGATYYSPEANLFADKVTVYRKEKRAILEGHVRMLVKAEADQDKPAKVEPIPELKRVDPDSFTIAPTELPQTPEQKKAIEDLRSTDTAKQFPTQVIADYVEYFYGKGNRKANIKGNPQARQDFTNGNWRHVWSDHAFYDGEKNLMTLYAENAEKNRARMKNSYGDDLDALWFLLSTKQDDEYNKGKDMKGHFYNTDEENEREKKKTPPTTGGGTGGSSQPIRR
jgi:lipopolysaccharide export system protein LptA